MKTILLILFSATYICYSQTNQITIIGYLPQLYGGDYVSFSKPMGKFTTLPEYIDSRDTATIKNDKFIKRLDISGPGLIYLFEKPFNSNISTRFFAEPGDTIVIERQNGEIIFKGKNAIINKMFSDVKLGPMTFNDEVYEIFKKYNNSDKIITKINDIQNKYFQYYNELYLKKQISKSCLEYTKIIAEQSLDGLVTSFSLNEEYREKHKMKITKKEAEKIIEFINLKYNRAEKKMQVSKQLHQRRPYLFNRAFSHFQGKSMETCC